MSIKDLDKLRQRDLIPYVLKQLVLELFNEFLRARGSCVYVNPRVLTRRICEKLKVSDKKVAPIVASVFKLLTDVGVVEEYRMGSKENTETPKRVVYRVDRASELWQLIMEIGKANEKKRDETTEKIVKTLEEKYLMKLKEEF